MGGIETPKPGRLLWDYLLGHFLAGWFEESNLTSLSSVPQLQFGLYNR